VDFAFSPEQEQLREVVRRFLGQKSPEAEVRRLMETPDGYDRAVWKQLAQELDLLGISIPESYGGSGFGFLELSVILEEMGRALFCAPYFSTVVLAASALLASGDAAACATFLPQIAAGDLIATFAIPPGRPDDGPSVAATRQQDGYILDGFADYVIDGHIADLIVVPATVDGGSSTSLFAVRAAQAQSPEAQSTEALAAEVLGRTLRPSMDATRKIARLEFKHAPAQLLGEPGSGQAVVDSVRAQAAVALASEQVGICQWGLAASVSYAKTRFQFARPIGSFQAVKHKIADMLVALESAKAVAYYAAWAVATDAPDLNVTSSLAKAECSEAALDVAAETIQVHGGIGFTWEHPAHLYFKRAKSAELFLGTPSYHRELMCQALGV
jgi:alkylation response protein AidB-like acyl-CoA dehydrogenase